MLLPQIVHVRRGVARVSLDRAGVQSDPILGALLPTRTRTTRVHHIHRATWRIEVDEDAGIEYDDAASTKDAGSYILGSCYYTRLADALC